MAEINYDMQQECRKLGLAMPKATALEALEVVERMFRLYGEQPITMEDAAAYVYTIRNGILETRLSATA